MTRGKKGIISVAGRLWTMTPLSDADSLRIAGLNGYASLNDFIKTHNNWFSETDDVGAIIDSHPLQQPGRGFRVQFPAVELPSLFTPDNPRPTTRPKDSGDGRPKRQGRAWSAEDKKAHSDRLRATWARKRAAKAAQ